MTTLHYALIAFGIASFLAGIAGALYGYLYGHLSLDAFTPLASVTFVTVAYIGGIGSITGALIAGMATAAKHLKKDIRIVGLEPAIMASFRPSMSCGHFRISRIW